MLDASHDGYLRRFGITHERRWRLAPQGQRLEGEDLFLSEGGTAEASKALIRFHLAPGIRASRAQGGRVVMLVLPNREAWQFEASLAEIWLEDSVYFAATEGPRRSEQIVLKLDLSTASSVRWRFERLARGTETAAAQRQPEPSPELL
jgi:uncharacterized heparinase superfamily protein